MELSEAKRIAERFGTPAYVFDLDMAADRIHLIRECLGGKVKICYAMKANPFLIKPLDTFVDSFEVCSPGEFRICERTGISMDQIVLSGVYKSAEDIDRMIGIYRGDGIYTVESFSHLQLISSAAERNGIKVKVLIRVTSGNQFGMDETDIFYIIENRHQYPSIDFVGLQLYSGTQKKKLSILEKELNYLDKLCTNLKEQLGFAVRQLEYGPGFFVPYFANDEELDNTEMLRQFGKLLNGLVFKGKITLEMGRYIAAECGYFITSVVDKKVNKNQNYLIVDGGIHHMNYYGQSMAMKIPHYHQISKNFAGREEQWNICGSLCTVSDIIVKQLVLTSPQIGDILVFERLGAYSITEGIYLFLSRDLPKVVFYSSKAGAELIRDTLATDSINSAE